MKRDGTLSREQRLLDSAVDCLREIASLKGTSKRQKGNSEIAANWLLTHGYPEDDGGYIPGVGFALHKPDSGSGS